jgi:hypothetical protein
MFEFSQGVMRTIKSQGAGNEEGCGVWGGNKHIMKSQCKTTQAL